MGDKNVEMNGKTIVEPDSTVNEQDVCAPVSMETDTTSDVQGREGGEICQMVKNIEIENSASRDPTLPETNETRPEGDKQVLMESVDEHAEEAKENPTIQDDTV